VKMRAKGYLTYVGPVAYVSQFGRELVDLALPIDRTKSTRSENLGV